MRMDAAISWSGIQSDVLLWAPIVFMGLLVFPSVAQPYSLEASATLTNWVSIFTNQTGASGSNFMQMPYTNNPHRFFRGKRWP